MQRCLPLPPSFEMLLWLQVTPGQEENPLARIPRYTTFRPGELEALLKKTALKNSAVADVPNAWDVRRHNPLHHRWYDCCVTYPDGATGTCHYTRQGPKWHIFRMVHENAQGVQTLPLQYHGEALGRDAESIQRMAQEKAISAFASAILEERKLYRRIQPPYGRRKADPASFQLTAKRAKELAGRYSVCVRLSGKLVPVVGTFETLEEANIVWREKGDPSLVVTLACRWTRRWERPRFNPLYEECRLHSANT